MAIKVPYSYNDFKVFPEATEASRRINILGVITGFLLIPIIMLFTALLSKHVSIIPAIIIAIIIGFLLLLGLRLLINGFHDTYVIRKLIPVLDLSEAQKKAAISYFTHDKIWGQADLNGAYNFARNLNGLYYKYKSQEITTEEYKRYRRPYLQELTSAGLPESEIDADLAEIKQYYFENAEEYNIYTKKHPDEKKIHWESKSKEYVDLIEQADLLFEQEEPTEALKKYKKALKLNPIGIKARYGMASCYSRLDQAEEAKQAILDMSDFFRTEEDIAYYYRALGYYLIKTGEYREAYACYKYSLFFEKTDTAFKGMSYIEKLTGKSYSKTKSEDVLKKANYLSYIAY